MDYKEIATILLVCSSKKGERCSHCPLFGMGDRHCRTNAMRCGARAITDLIEVIQAAEARCKRLDEARERANEEAAKWESAYKLALERAEKAERQRDAAINELDGVSSMVYDLADFVDDEIHPVIDYNLYLSLRENVDAISMFQHESEWRGKKGE